MRNRHLPGKRGYLLGRANPKLKQEAFAVDPIYDKSFDIFADQLRRNSWDFVRRGHRLDIQSDYYGFYRLLCKKLEEKLLQSRIEYVIFFEIPHLAIDYALYLVSKKLNIPTLILSQKIPGKIFSMWDIHDFGNLQIDKTLTTNESTTNVDVNLFYMDARWQQKSPRGQFNFTILCRLLRNVLYSQPNLFIAPADLFKIIKRAHKVITKLPKWRDFTKFAYSEAQLRYFERLCDFEGNEVNFDSDFVYVPLHLQPEMTTSSWEVNLLIKRFW